MSTDARIIRSVYKIKKSAFRRQIRPQSRRRGRRMRVGRCRRSRTKTEIVRKETIRNDTCIGVKTLTATRTAVGFKHDNVTSSRPICFRVRWHRQSFTSIRRVRFIKWTFHRFCVWKQPNLLRTGESVENSHTLFHRLLGRDDRFFGCTTTTTKPTFYY